MIIEKRLLAVQAEAVTEPADGNATVQRRNHRFQQTRVAISEVDGLRFCDPCYGAQRSHIPRYALYRIQCEISEAGKLEPRGCARVLPVYAHLVQAQVQTGDPHAVELAALELLNALQIRAAASVRKVQFNDARDFRRCFGHACGTLFLLPRLPLLLALVVLSSNGARQQQCCDNGDPKVAHGGSYWFMGCAQ